MKYLRIGNRLVSIRLCSNKADKIGSSASTADDGKVLSKDMKIAREKQAVNEFVLKTNMPAPAEFREIFPDFMPQPDYTKRHPICEKLERIDMLRRRDVIDIPEFYVGSIMAVTISDRYAPKRANRFVGICIQRDDRGLRYHFTLRNVVDGLGVEYRFYAYHPLMQKIEVLKLEKHPDAELFYLRDALPEYCTFPFNMDAVPHVPGASVPISSTKVKLRPPPHNQYWHKQYHLQGIDFDHLWQLITSYKKMFYYKVGFEWWRDYDIVDQYKKTITKADQQIVYDDVAEYERKQLFDKPSASAGSRRTTFLQPLFRAHLKKQSLAKVKEEAEAQKTN